MEHENLLYTLHKQPPLVPVRRQANPILAIPSNTLKILPNVILPPIPSPFQWLHISWFSNSVPL